MDLYYNSDLTDQDSTWPSLPPSIPLRPPVPSSSSSSETNCTHKWIARKGRGRVTYRVQFTPPPPTCGYPTPPPQKTTGGGKKNVAVTACRGEESHILVSLFFFFFGDPSSVVAPFLRSLVRGRFALLFSRMGDRCPVSRPPDGEEEKRENQDILHMLEQWLGNRRWKAEGEVFMADGENSSLPLARAAAYYSIRTREVSISGAP